MVEYFRRLIPQRRAGSGEDMFSRLCRAESEEGARWIIVVTMHRDGRDARIDGAVRGGDLVRGGVVGFDAENVLAAASAGVTFVPARVEIRVGSVPRLVDGSIR